MNVYIKVEIKEREFLSRFILGAYTALKGNEVYIGDDELLQLVETKELNPGIILEKSIPPKKLRINQLRNYKKNKCIVTSIDEEGGLATINYKKNFAPRRFSNKTLLHTDMVFCWGRYDYNLNKKLFPKYKKKFLITGNPRYDLLKEKISYQFFDKRDHALKKKKIIIISSHMIHAIKKETLLEASSLKNNYIDEMISFRKSISDNYLKLINNITKSYKDLTVEIWVHPKESLKKWKTIVPKSKNIKFVEGKKFLLKNNNNDELIYIHNGSLMAFDVLLKKKNVISFQPIKHRLNKTFPNKFSKIVYNEKQIFLLIDKLIKKNKKINFSYENKINKLINNSKNFDACEMITSHWQKYKTKSLEKKNRALFVKIKNKIRLFRQSINYIIYNNKFAPFTNSEISILKKKIEKIEPEFAKLKIKLLGPKLISLKKK